MSGIMIALCLILVSTGIAFSLFRGSNDYDISYIEGDETIDSNNDPELDEEDIKDELLGEIAREKGIVLQVSTFMSQQGDVISYFTDGTAIIVKTNGKIYRVSTNNKGGYGVNKNGKIDSTAKKILVNSTTTTLMDGTIITNYSDGTAKVEHKSQTYFVRDDNNVKIENGSTLDTLAPSGVAPTRETSKVDTTILKKFTDNTALMIVGAQKFIINKNTEVTIENNKINYSQPNTFAAIGEQKYKDDIIITYFSNGSAIITEPNGNITYLKNSGDLVLKGKKLYEIIPHEKERYSRTTFNIADRKRVTYFDNGAAIIINSDGKRQYVEDSDNIVYDNKKHINGNPETIKQISVKETTDGHIAYNFDNGKSQVITSNRESYIIDTDKLKFKIKDDIEDEIPEDDEDEDDDDSSSGGNTKPGEGIYISEAENIYNDFKNVENTKFIIRNKNTTRKKLRITIEEVSDYLKYNTDRLPPQFVNFQATVGDSNVKKTTLTQNIWIDEEEKTNYVIYEGTINPQKSVEVNLILQVDYENLNNDYNKKDKNYGFIGTIRIYVDDEAT